MELYRGDSYTIGIKFNEEYDIERIQEIELNIGNLLFGKLSDNSLDKDANDVFVCKIPSEKTMEFYGGKYKVTLHVQDEILGIKKQEIGKIDVKSSNNKTSNESINALYDALFVVKINETQVTVEHVFRDILKGDKGDPFLYSDFTPEQIAELQRPATDAATAVNEAEALRVTAETTRVENEQVRKDAEELRVTAEELRVTAEGTRQANTAIAITNANNAATNANTKAGLADTARTELTTAVNTKLGEADGKIEEMNTTLSTYDGRVTQVESDIDQLAVKASIAYSVIEPSKNLFDKNSIIDGFYIQTTGGILKGEATSAVSPLIPVIGGQMYYLSGRNCTGYTELRFLNASGTPLKPLNPDTGVELAIYSLGYLNGRVLAPATAVYVQFTTKFVGVGTFDAIQFELGNTQTSYSPFGYRIKNSALENVVTQEELDTVESIANEANSNADLALMNIEGLQTGLATRVNTSENTPVPGAYPTVADQANYFGITVSADTDSPVKNYVGYKRTFLTNLQSGNGTSYRTWALPLAGQARPSEIGVSFWTKKSEFQAIYVSQFQSYLGLALFNLNPTPAFSGTPVVANATVTSSVELSSAKLEFSVIAEVGDYVRIKLKYYDLVWKGTFTGSSMTYYWLFNGSYANGKPLTMIDFTCLLGSQAVGMLVYPDSGTLTGTETIKGAYALGNSNALRITALESSSSGSGSGVRMKKVGNMLYIASPWDATYDLVKSVEVIRSSSYTNNPDANFVNEYLCAKGGDPSVSAVFLKYSNDDICPASLNNSYIGGNHSWNQGYNVQMTGHGKTLADIGSVYRNGSNVEFVIARIVDANNIWMISKNQAVDGFTYSFAQPSGTLTYYSNGSNTGNIVVASSSGLGNTCTTVAPATVKVLMDGKTEITSDGTYYGRYIDIVESYDALDLPSIVLQLIANRPSGGYTSAPQLNSLAGTEKLFNHAINYRFTKNGNTVVSTTFRAYKKLVMKFHGFIQAGALGSGNIYCPKSLPISDGSTTYDLRQICNWTTPPAISLNLTPTYWENPLSPPDRVINLNTTVALMLGYITDRGIQSSRKDVVYNAMFLNNTRKLYPMGVHNQSTVAIDPNTSYSCIAYRTYTNPVANPAGRTNYAYVEVGGSVFIFLDYHGALNDSIIPETEWVGRSITVYEKNNKCTLIGNVVTGAIEVLSTATSTDPGYIVLKLS